RICTVVGTTQAQRSNKLWLRFKSDQVDSRSGFSIYWDVASTGCGGNLTTPTGLFTSPNYPMPYYHSSECYWLLEASHGSPFQLEFQDFHLEHHPSCSLDYLAVLCDNVVIVNKTHGILESINYPKPYNNDQRCNWTIQATRGNTVNYTFLDIEVEDDQDCHTDYLE
ncbi:hypothetical protein A6R68_17827, partial [Neotoma lepida]